MNIVMVSGHACIRVQKMALPFIELGIPIHLIAQATPSYYQYYKTFSFAAGVGQYIEAFKQYEKIADVFHVHNEPSWFVSAIKETVDTPVVLDVHDSYTARMTNEEVQEFREQGKNVSRIFVEERNNFQLADALVFPGEVFGTLVKDTFDLKQPSLTLPSYCPKRFYGYSGEEWIGGLVYEGKVNLKEENQDSMYGLRYSEYLELAQKAHELGIGFHIYCPRSDEPFMKAFDDIAFLQQARPIETLIRGIARHDWGLVGNVFPTPEWDVAYPNKMFEYIAACVPVVAINAPECGKFIVKEGLGIEVESLEELKLRWDEHTEIRKNIIKKRQKYAMENHIHKLLDLYKSLI
jgi:glycosyltransferase involved in cell wall biosynthesis